MEDQIITLKTYESTVDAMVDQELLRANDIDCFINNDQLVELYPMFKAIDEGLKIVVFEKDFERALKILAEIKEDSNIRNKPVAQNAEEIAENHYLFSFSDTDIIDVVANPTDWTKEEQYIANQIIKHRGLIITPEDIQKARNKKTEQEVSEKISEKKSPNRMYQWFFVIGILSVINTVILAAKSTVHFIFGLGITQIIDTLSFTTFENYKAVVLVFSFLISGIFIALGYFAKAKLKWAYLTGLVLYGLDTTIFVYSNDWLSAAFHIFVLIAIIRGYISLYPEKQNTASN